MEASRKLGVSVVVIECIAHTDPQLVCWFDTTTSETHVVTAVKVV